MRVPIDRAAIHPIRLTIEQRMWTILGANGVIGRELSNAVAGSRPLRQVSRSPRKEHSSDEAVPADLTDPKATDRAVAGSEIAFLVAGLKYDTRVWQEQWPKVMRNAIDACKRHRARLVFFDNVYAYGRVNGPMTEETPFNPTSRKGEVRARIATTLLEEMRSGELDGMIVRAADFYGPGATLALTHVTVFERLRKGRKAQWIGDPRAIHTFTFTPDAGRALARLAATPDAFGQTWHAPTAPEPITGEDFVRAACAAANRPYELQVVPSWMLRLMGLLIPQLRENQEMMYQFEHDYRFDSRKIRERLGLAATPYEKGIASTLA